MPWADQGEGESGDALLLMPPPAPAQVGDYMRGFIALGTVDHVVQDPIDRSGKNSYELLHDVYAPDLLVALQDPDPTSSARYPAEGGVPTNSRGEYVVPGVPRVVPAVPPNPPTFKEYNVGCSADKG